MQALAISANILTAAHRACLDRTNGLGRERVRNFSAALTPQSGCHTRVALMKRRTVARAAETSTAEEYVAYDSKRSVFPAEACEEIGGDCCDAETGPEVRLPPKAEMPVDLSEGPDREVTSYDGPKTVFPGDACENLGGEFCEPEYQEGVGKEK